ncbi:MAG: cobalt-precorrin-5B (C(1))-methyltransferase [Nitrospirae bacterium]|nr:cobalt-precorrin-5B (C(1))-methyltransferase [Nitrospirota bacterium]
MKKKLRSGYTTGACAAAAAKAAMLVMRNALCVMRNKPDEKPVTHHSLSITHVEIPFPDGSRVCFKVHNSKLITHHSSLIARASVIKDAGDDPDVTNRAEIVATIQVKSEKLEVGSKRFLDALFFTSHFLVPTSHLLIIKGGKGVGIVTKPGLPVPVRESAINPVPRKMIEKAVMEAMQDAGCKMQDLKRTASVLEITISVPNGEELAKKTLNHRLGIIGGISILGTTGIVKPISSEAWTATITSSMDVAKAMGHQEIVISAGRTSEKSHMKKFNFPEEYYIMMGDYLEYSLLEAKTHGFKKIHLCAQWAKMLKVAMSTPQTHVKHGAIDIKKTIEFLKGLGVMDWGLAQEFNTAMEIFEFISASRITHHASLFLKVCVAAKKYAESIASGIPVISYLVSYEGKIIANSE